MAYRMKKMILSFIPALLFLSCAGLQTGSEGSKGVRLEVLRSAPTGGNKLKRLVFEPEAKILINAPAANRFDPDKTGSSDLFRPAQW